MKHPAPSAYVTEFFEYMTEVPGRTNGTGSKNYGPYKLHKTIGQAKNAVLGSREFSKGADSAIYKWNPDKEAWDLLYVSTSTNRKPWLND